MQERITMAQVNEYIESRKDWEPVELAQTRFFKVPGHCHFLTYRELVIHAKKIIRGLAVLASKAED